MAGLKLEIPEHLIGLFKILQRHGHQMRSKFGKEFTRHIRMSDEDLSLKLDVKLPNESDWQTISASLAMELQDSEREQKERRLRDRLASSSDCPFDNVSLNSQPAQSTSSSRGQPRPRGMTWNGVYKTSEPSRGWRPFSTGSY